MKNLLYPEMMISPFAMFLFRNKSAAFEWNIYFRPNSDKLAYNSDRKDFYCSDIDKIRNPFIEINLGEFRKRKENLYHKFGRGLDQRTLCGTKFGQIHVPYFLIFFIYSQATMKVSIFAHTICFFCDTQRTPFNSLELVIKYPPTDRIPIS
jgi:hypothetical protein